MNRALVTLVLIRYKAQLRKLFFGSGSKKRFVVAIGLVFMTIYFGLIVFSQTFGSAGSRKGIPPGSPGNRITTIPAEVAPWLVACFCLLPLASPKKRDTINFIPAEVDLLFPGPFTRKQLIGYKIMHQAGVALLVSFWLSIFFQRQAGSYLGCAVALVLTFQISSLMAILGPQLLAPAPTRTRRVLYLSALAAAPALLAWALLSAYLAGATDNLLVFLRAASESHPGVALAAPFEPMAGLLLSKGVDGPFFTNIAIGLGMIFVMVWLVLTLDAGTLEAALTQSEKMQTKIERMRKGIANPEKAAKRTVRMLPRMGGAGTVAWRHLAALVRGTSLTAAVLLVLVLVGSFAWMTGMVGAMGWAIIPVLMGVISLFFPALVRSDFRADLDHIETLKTLPLSANAIAWGEVLIPTLLLTALQWLLIGVVGITSKAEPGVILALAAAAGPLCCIMVAMENFVFLLIPTRVKHRQGADPQAFGRAFILSLVRIGVLIPIAIVAGLPMVGVWAVTESLAGVIFTGALALAAAAPVMVWFVGWMYGRFDVSVDMPG